MSVFKRFKGKRLNARDKEWPKGTWYVWKRINGRIIHKSIPEAQTKEQAEIAERRIIEAAFNRRYGVRDSVPFAEFADGPYTRYYKQHNVNLANKRLNVEYLVDRLGKRPLGDITPQDCRDVQWHLARKLSASSVNGIMSTLSRIFSLACEENVLEHNPMQYVKKLKEPTPRSRLLTNEEKDRLWNELDKDVLLRRLVILAINLPLRRGQLLAITPDAIDEQRGVLWAVQSKGRDPRMVPLNSTALDTLREMIRDRQLPFPVDPRKRWERALENAKITNFRFHDLRKEFASGLIRKNVNPALVQRLFAHSDMKITNVYMHSEIDELHAAVNTLDPVSATILQPSDNETDLPN